MKVSRGASQSLHQAAKQKENQGIQSKNKGRKMGVSPASSAQVNFSKQAQHIKKATDIARDDSVDEKKIAMFQNLIDNGKYKIDSAKIADKLVDDHMKMPS